MTESDESFHYVRLRDKVHIGVACEHVLDSKRSKTSFVHNKHCCSFYSVCTLKLTCSEIGLVLRRVFSTTSSGVSTLNTVIIVFRLIIYYTPVVLEGGLQIGFDTD